ncbi:WhiB family transcriptional regulator [Streptomyces sp. NPDC096310]|uniref:WhiB family transcriptional regulator n=1 Tax=Streptomyces sp. NPDC096310 TaxID=3366082 RepID=UPI0037FEE2D2
MSTHARRAPPRLGRGRRADRRGARRNGRLAVAAIPIGGAVPFDPTRRWVSHASCRTVAASRFFVDGAPSPAFQPTEAQRAGWDEAKKTCARCPVMAECRRNSLGEEYGVWGGRDERQRYLIRTKLAQQAKRRPEQKRLAWGEALEHPREQGYGWTRIHAMTGIDDRLGELLTDKWVTHRTVNAQPPAAVVACRSRSPGARRRRRSPRSLAGATPGSAVPGASPMRTTAARGRTGAGSRSSSAPARARASRSSRPRTCGSVTPQPVVIVTYIGRPDREQPATRAG